VSKFLARELLLLLLLLSVTSSSFDDDIDDELHRQYKLQINLLYSFKLARLPKLSRVFHPKLIDPEHQICHSGFSHPLARLQKHFSLKIYFYHSVKNGMTCVELTAMEHIFFVRNPIESV